MKTFFRMKTWILNLFYRKMEVFEKNELTLAQIFLRTESVRQTVKTSYSPIMFFICARFYLWRHFSFKKWGFSDFCPKLNHFVEPKDILERWDGGIMCSTHVIWIFAYFWINFNMRCPFGTSKTIQMILIPFHKWLEIE